MPSPGITKRILANAMKELMETKPFSKISVSDIVEACSLNRNSFYYHFKDKYDLVNWIFYTEMVEYVNREGVGEDSSWIMLEKLLHFFFRDRAFYANALSVTGQNSFAEYFEDLLKTLIRSRSGELYLEDEYQDYYIAFFVDAFVATVYRWIREGCKLPPEKLAEIMRNATTGAAMRILEQTGEMP